MFEPLPLHSIYGGKRRGEMDVQWKRSRCKLPLAAALNLIIIFSFFIMPIFFIAGLFIFSDALAALGLCLIAFCMALLSGFKLPSFMQARFCSQIEQDLPQCLRSISLNLRIGLQFERAIQSAADSNYSCSILFFEILQSINSGSSAPAALSRASQDCGSLDFTRATHSLSLIYSEGAPPDSLDALSDEIISRQSSAIKLQSSRASLLALLYVASSSLLPAFFIILNITAAPIMGLQTGTPTIFLFYLLALPAINLAIIILMFLISPSLQPCIRSRQIDAQASRLCAQSGILCLSSKKTLFLSITLAALALSFSLMFLPQFAILLALIFASLPFAAKAYFEAIALGDANSLEQELANMLFAGASEQKLSLEKMLSYASNSPSPSLSREAKAALRQINAGANPQKVLQDWAQQTPSALLSRTLMLAMLGYKSGSNMQKALQTAASDLMSSFNLVRERAALLSLQNYTLMAASALLVPAILAVSISFASQISQITSSGSGLDIFGKTDTAALISAAMLSIPAYLAINSALSAFFASTTQGARHKFLQYALLIGIISQAVWILALQIQA